jgi:hypothetical protein
VGAGVFVAEDMVGAGALDSADLLRAARGPRAGAEVVGVAVEEVGLDSRAASLESNRSRRSVSRLTAW